MLQTSIEPAIAYRRPLSAVVSLADEIGAACDSPAGAMGRRIIAALEAAHARPDLLTPAQRMPSPLCYARHVLHSDPMGRFTILAIVWGAGQFSPPHAHETWCAYAVCGDQLLTETEYSYDAATRKAVPLRTVERRAGYCCFGEAGLDQIHRLGNAGARPAISLHVYGVEQGRIATHVNRMVDVA